MRRSRPCRAVIGVGLWGIFLLLAPANAAAAVKNVIVLIADGCAAEQYTLARWFKGAPLALDAIRVGAVTTYIADSVVADSAPAASAYATGVRTSDKFISVGPRAETISTVPVPPPELRLRPQATVLEGARLLGKATGIVVTSRVSHATPGAYLAHTPERDKEEVIMEQAVYQNADVVLGGGRDMLLPKAEGGRRSDGENLLDVIKERGYTWVDTAEGLQRVASGRVFGCFASGPLEAEIDRSEFGPSQPTLEAMTRKAIELLSADPDGFFLMVEGSQVDWACHANDPAQLMSDLLMYDRAVQAALDFARADGHTLVVALSDHNTGGMSIGNYGTSHSYSQMRPEALLDPLRAMHLSAPGLWRKLGEEKTPEKVREVVRQYWGMTIDSAEAERILAIALKSGNAPWNGFGEVLSPAHTAIGWTTHGHCGGDVPLHAFGPERPTGLVDAPEIGRLTARALGVNLERLTARLLVDAGEAFKDGQVEVVDPDNPLVRITVDGRVAELPANKNLLRLEGKTIPLEGVVVSVAATGRVFLPQQAVELIRHSQAALPMIGE